MKWINGEIESSKISRKEEWHKWFAWYPIIIGNIYVNGKNRAIKAWLEPVFRIGRLDKFSFSIFNEWSYTYKELKETNNPSHGEVAV